MMRIGDVMKLGVKLFAVIFILTVFASMLLYPFQESFYKISFRFIFTTGIILPRVVAVSEHASRSRSGLSYFIRQV